MAAIAKWFSAFFLISAVLGAPAAVDAQAISPLLTIESPAANTTVVPGQRVVVSVRRAPGSNIRSVALHSFDWSESATGQDDPLTFTFDVPQDAQPGVVQLVAADTTIRPSLGMGIVSAPVPVIVEAPKLIGIRSNLDSVFLKFIGDEARLSIYGRTVGGRSVKLDGLPRLVFASQIAAYAQVDQAGAVRAAGAGNTQVVVTYTNVDGSIVNATIPVTVAASSGGDLNADGKVDDHDVSILQSAMGTVTASNDARDLNRNGRVDDTDVQLLTALFSSPPKTCTFVKNRPSFSSAGIGDRVSLRVTASDSSCDWSIASGGSWISAYPISAKAGSGLGWIEMAANQTAARTGNSVVAGQSVSIWQAAANCSFTPTLPSTTIAPSGGTATLTITTTPGCAWKAVAAPGWVSFPAASEGTGTGTVQVSFAVNTTAQPRTGLIEVGGQTIQLVQQRSNTPAPVAPFTDVPLTHAFADYITLMKQYGITNGCGATTYCPEDQVTRGQMAVFVVRSILGGDNFTFSSSPYFTDVPASHQFFKWIQKMKELGVTAGCGTTTYCPNDPVTRGQMAAFIMRGKLGVAPSQTFPFTTARVFTDVPSSHIFYPYVQKMRDTAVTFGCGVNTFCPDEPTTRGQMAAFIIRAFFTP